MKKRMFTTVLALVLVMSLFVACREKNKETSNRGSAQENTINANDETNSEVEIIISPSYVGTKGAEIVFTWQPVPGHSMFSTDASRVTYLEDRARKWAEENPGVGVEIIETTTNMNEAMAKNLIQLSAGASVPDVAAIDSFIFPRFQAYAQPIGDILEEKGIIVDDFFPYVQGVVKPEDDVLGLWYTTDVRVMYYRKDLIDTPPTTIDELITTGRELTEEGYTALLYAANLETTLTDVLLPLFWGQGGKLVDEAGKPVFGEGINREYMLKALEFYTKTIKEGISPERVIEVGSSGFTADVATDNLAMFIAGNWEAKKQRSVVGDLFDEKWGVAPIPMVNAGTRQSTAGGWIQAVFSEDEQIQKLATDFVITLYGDDEGMEGWCSVGGYLPPRESVFASESIKADIFAEAYKEELNYAGVRPAAEIYSEISTGLQLICEKLVINNESPEILLDEVYQEVLLEYETITN